MSDQTTAPENETPVEAPTDDVRVADTIVQPDVAAPENALVGDDAQPAPREPSIAVDTDAVPAQTTGPAPKVVDTVYVHETSVALDEVITDPHSPEAVQIPDAGRGFLDLPIHGLDAKTPEQIFADHGDE